MPHPPPSLVQSRVRRTKNKDGRSTVSSSSKGSKKLSKSSPPQSPSSPAPSLFAQQNVTLDKLPPLPESGTASPSSHTSRSYHPSPTLSRAEVIAPASQDLVTRPPPPRPTVEEDQSDIGTPFAQPAHSTALTTIQAQEAVPTTSTNTSHEHSQIPSHHLSSLPSPPSQRSYSSSSIRSEISNYTGQFFPPTQSPYLFHNQPYDQFPTSPPPLHGYPPVNHFYPPPGTGVHYYSMPPSNGFQSPPGFPTAQPWPPPQHPVVNGLGRVTPGAPNSNPLRDPSLQRQASPSSKASHSADAPIVVPVTPTSLPSMPTLDMAGNGSTGKNDPRDLHHRVESYLPDIQLLLKHYRDAQDQLDDREGLLRKVNEQADLVKQKQYFADSLEKELKNSATAHSTESSKLRMEVGNLEEKLREFEENLRLSERVKRDLQIAKQALEKEIRDLEKNAKGEKESIVRDFEDWKRKSNQAFETDKRHMEEEYDKRMRIQEDSFKAQRAESMNAFVKEKDSMRASWARQSREMEAEFDKLRRSLESKLDGKQRDLEETLRNERDRRETWAREREELLKNWEEERAGMGKGWEEQRNVLTKQHKKEKDELEKKRLEFQSSFVKKAETERKALESEKGKLKKSWDEDKMKHERMIMELRSVVDNLGIEKNRLQKMVETFGEVTDWKSKGDTYYIDAFSQLSKQIVDLSEGHFNNLPIAPPDEILNKVPVGIPSFTANTNASRQLRAAYIQHNVSSILCYRVFQPFLFSLGRRYDKADTLFQAMSNELRNKSTRKEAVWRQHTLFAAYTASSAKKTINAAAGLVVEEIVEKLRHWAEPKSRDLINVAVRRIVKLAAEAWRLARLEREMITARMPAAEDLAEVEKEWPGHEYPQAWSKTGNPAGAKERRTLLLRLLPIISREPIHHDFRTEAEKNDNGCVYSHGVALYSDSSPVLDRLAELQSASNERHSSQRGSMTPPPSPLLPTGHSLAATGVQSRIEDHSSNIEWREKPRHRGSQRSGRSRLPGSFDSYDHSPAEDGEGGNKISYSSSSSDGGHVEGAGGRPMSRASRKKEWNEGYTDNAADVPDWGHERVPGGSDHW